MFNLTVNTRNIVVIAKMLVLLGLTVFQLWIALNCCIYDTILHIVKLFMAKLRLSTKGLPHFAHKSILGSRFRWDVTYSLPTLRCGYTHCITLQHCTPSNIAEMWQTTDTTKWPWNHCIRRLLIQQTLWKILSLLAMKNIWCISLSGTVLYGQYLYTKDSATIRAPYSAIAWQATP